MNICHIPVVVVGQLTTDDVYLIKSMIQEKGEVIILHYLNLKTIVSSVIDKAWDNIKLRFPDGKFIKYDDGFKIYHTDCSTHFLFFEAMSPDDRTIKVLQRWYKERIKVPKLQILYYILEMIKKLLFDVLGDNNIDFSFNVKEGAISISNSKVKIFENIPNKVESVAPYDLVENTEKNLVSIFVEAPRSIHTQFTFDNQSNKFILKIFGDKKELYDPNEVSIKKKYIKYGNIFHQIEVPNGYINTSLREEYHEHLGLWEFKFKKFEEINISNGDLMKENLEKSKTTNT